MLIAQVTVGLHCQRSTVLMAEPSRNGRNIDARFNTSRCEQMPQIVMGDSHHADALGGIVDRLLSFSDAQNLFAFQFVCASVPHALQESNGISDQGNMANGPILCSSFSVAANREATVFEIHITPRYFRSLSLAASGERE